ncbi:MAG: hypothetical protein OXB88_03145 [Bacteriovoracales bacterium]|nr:hypothetical protein [Bacteriovoracales bacterium]
MGPHDLIDAWCRAVETGDAEKVLSFYEEDALLKPTLSSKIRSGLQAIEDYFVGNEEERGFLKRGIKTVSYKVEKELYLDHALIVMGVYEFKSDTETVKAHFTFVLKESSQQSKILAQHSSLYH